MDVALENWTIERTLTALLTDRLVLYHYTYSTTTIERFSIHTVLLHSSFFYPLSVLPFYIRVFILTDGNNFYLRARHFKRI